MAYYFICHTDSRDLVSKVYCLSYYKTNSRVMSPFQRSYTISGIWTENEICREKGFLRQNNIRKGNDWHTELF